PVGVSGPARVLEDFAREAAAALAAALPRTGSVVITGGGTAEEVYPLLARARPDWSRLDVFFSDERCVPPDHEASNYGMARRTLLDAVRPRRVHRMKGEIDAQDAAAIYDQAVVDPFDLVILGLGDDAHVAGLFPDSPGLLEAASCVAVDRPDGMRGLSLTPPALLSATQVVFVVSGGSKAEAVRRALAGDEDVMTCPAAMFRDHGSVTFLLDAAAAARL
ncbi:MAG: 6-phosphogluconolactonase, partial [Actinomycetota bacterium]|nr:6-phosphogluconolactonase [Actinomycetota bacterium]